MHFFWIFGHPEVYVLVIPAFAFVSEIIPVFSRKAIFGYPVMVAATVGIGFVSMSVWAHHMFTVGMNSYANSFFVITTMAVGVPTGIKIFNWLAPCGEERFSSRRRCCSASVSLPVPDRRSDRHHAGCGALRLAARQLVLRGRAFPLRHRRRNPLRALRRLLLLVPEDDRQMYSETLGKLHFWLFLIGFHLTFDFMHIPGLLGMPRRIYTYEPGRGWDIWNLIVTIGVVFQAAAILVFVGNLSGPISRANSPATIPGTPGRSNGPQPRRRPLTTSRRFPSCRSRRRSGTSSTRKIRTGNTSKQ